MKGIDIKRPGMNWKKEIFFFLGLLILIGAVFGYVAWNKKSKVAVEETRNKIIIAAGIDEDFFKREKPPESEPKPEPEPEPDLEPLVPPVKIVLPPQPTPKSSPPPKAKDLFNVYKQGKTNKKITTLNNRRRGAVEINVKSEPKPPGENVINKIQGKWKEEKTNATLPINMSRVLTVDRFIPAILVPEINSELSGKVVAQVESHVFGAHGRKILIPGGTKAIGRYKPLTKIGSERLDVKWIRMITPDGINIHCENAEMADAMGRSGITGDVDNKYFDRYGISLLVSAFTATTSYSIPVKNESQQLVIESFGQEQSSLAKTILEENLEIKPTVTIPYGSRILISPLKDIWFKKLNDNEVIITPVEG